MDYFRKYQKYKIKYNQLKDSCGGARNTKDEVRIFFLTENVYNECLREDKSIKAKYDKLNEKINKRRSELKEIESNMMGLEQMEKIEDELEHDTDTDTDSTQLGGLLSLFKKSASDKVKAQQQKLDSSHAKSEKKIEAIQAKAQQKEQKQHEKKEKASKQYALVRQKIIKEEKEKIANLEKKLKALEERLQNSTRKCNLSVYGNKLYNVLLTSVGTLRESVGYALENHAPYVVQNSNSFNYIDANGKSEHKETLDKKFDYTNKSHLQHVMKLMKKHNRDNTFTRMVVVKKNITSPDILISVYDIVGNEFNIRNPIK